MKITITQANGWTKLFEPIKALTLVGSADFADIKLSSPSISSIHLQILTDPQLPTGLRVIGIDGRTEIVTAQGTLFLEAFAIYDISEGDEIKIGEYLLKFQPSQRFSQSNSAGNIQAQLKFLDTVLQPNLDLTGYLAISNAGEMDACQFDVKLDGISQDCYQLDPVPMLHPGGQEEIGMRLFHRKTNPPAGNLDLVLTITAPNSYPGETYKLKQSLYVTPDFSQSIDIVDDLAAGVEVAQKINRGKAASSISNNSVSGGSGKSINANTMDSGHIFKAADANQAVPIVMPPETQIDQSGSTQTLNAPLTADPSTRTSVDAQPPNDKRVVESVESAEKPTLQNARELDLKKVKIVHNNSEDYWEES